VTGPGGDEATQQGSRLEAVAAGLHHHPADPNDGVVRARLGGRAIVTALVAAAVTVIGFVLFALAIGGNH
jgi:hypothetical protein